MSNKTLNDIIKEEFTKLMSELDQSIISEQPVNAYGEVITPEKVASVKARRAGLQKKLARQKRTAAASEKAARAAAVTDRVARGADPAQAAEREGISLADYSAQTAKTGPDMAGVPKALPAAKNIARANRQGKRALARRDRRRKGKATLKKAGYGGDYDKFYADLETAGLTHMLGDAGPDKDWGKGHQAAFDALQAAGGPQMRPDQLADTTEDPMAAALAGGATGADATQGIPAPKPLKTSSGEVYAYSPGEPESEAGEPISLPEPQMTMAGGAAMGDRVATKPAPKPKRDDLYESKQLDRMKLLAGVNKKDK